MSSVPMETPAAPAGLSQFERVAKTFYEPSATMTDIRRSATWWLPWLLMSLMSYTFVFTIHQKIGFEKVSENQIQLNPKAAERMEKLTPEQRDQQMKISVAFTKGIMYAFPVFQALAIIVIGLLLMVIVNFGLGAKIGVKSAWAIVAYSYLPGMLGTVIAVATAWFADPDGYDIRRPVSSNLGAFVSITDHPALATFLGTFDVFTIWYVFLMALGVSKVSEKKIKTGTAFAAIFGCLLVWKLIASGFAAMF